MNYSALKALPPVERYRLFAALYRNSLSAFIQKSFGIVSAGDAYLHNWHIDVIADRLEKCAKGEIKRLIITVPPRYGKSICVSVAYIAWLLGKTPAAKVIAISYGSDLAEKHAADCKKLMSSPFYQHIFPDLRLQNKENTKTQFKTHCGGFRLATSVGGPLTGLGGDGLVQPEGSVMAVVEYDGCQFLCGGSGRSIKKLRPAGNIQFRSGQPVYIV